MQTKDCKMSGMPWVSPYLCVPDVEESIKFYEQAFGLKAKHAPVKNEEGRAVHCELGYQEEVVMIGLEGAYDKETLSPVTSGANSPMSLYLYCQDVDAFCKHAQSMGAKILTEPEDTFGATACAALKISMDTYGLLPPIFKKRINR